jgi:hypothetical protein
MTSKDKAKELIEAYKSMDIDNPHEGLGGYYMNMSLDDAKSCALLTADTVLSVIDIYPKHQMSASEIEAVEYWKNVKSEIEKL